MPSSSMPDRTTLAGIVQQVADAIFIVDAEQILQYANFTATENCLPIEQHGQPLTRLIPLTANETLYHHLEWVIATGRPWSGQLRYQRCGETQPTIKDVHIFPLGGSVPHYAITEHFPHQMSPSQEDYPGVYLEISNVLGVAQDSHTLSALFLHKVQELLGVYTLAIGLLEGVTPEQGYNIHISYATPPWDGWIDKNVLCSFLLRQSLDEQHIIHLTNLQQITTSHCIIGRNLGPIQELLIIPLAIENENLGVLLVGSLTTITHRQKKELRALASMFSRALHRQSLHENLNDQIALLKKTQAELIRTEKLASLGVLLAGVAHELNNPLTSIILYTQLALENLQQHPAREDLEQVLTLSRRAAQVIRGMLEFSARKHSRVEPVFIATALEDTLSLVKHEIKARRIQIHKDIAPELPAVLASSVQIQQVFINLIINAIHAITERQAQLPAPEVGQITIQAYVEAADTGQQVHITVRDNGIGMTEEVLRHIFDPFYTTREVGQGTGLGLSICHGIITRYGGKIWAESVPNQGSTFHVILPAATPEAIQQILRKRETGPLSGGTQIPCRDRPYRLLVVDDEASIRHIFTRVLKRAGYEVEAVDNGRDALTQILQQDYDLVLCDINIPRLSGDQIYRRLETEKPSMLQRVLFITGDTHNRQIQQFLSQTDAPFLTKPFDLEDFLRAVQEALAQQE